MLEWDDCIRIWPLSSPEFGTPGAAGFGEFGFLAVLILTSLLPASENMLPWIMGFTIVISCLLRRARLIRILRATIPQNPPWYYICRKSALSLQLPIPQILALSTLP